MDQVNQDVENPAAAVLAAENVDGVVVEEGVGPPHDDAALMNIENMIGAILGVLCNVQDLEVLQAIGGEMGIGEDISRKCN